MKKALGVLVFVALSGVFVAAGFGYWGYRVLHEPYRATDDEMFEVTSGENATGILDRLEAQGFIADSRLARLYLVLVLDDPPLKTGEYRFQEPMSCPELLDQLIEGAVATHPVRVLEGLTLDETAQAIADQGFGELEALLEVMRSPEMIAELDPEATDLEGYLFPDTYSFPRSITSRQIVAELVANFRRKYELIMSPLPTNPQLERLPRDLVSLASIVEKEALLDRERPLIASVYTNRMRIGMGLYADPTVIFALKTMGTWNGNLRRKDLELDHPYNTYRIAGLPPGPIASPGLASLEAAARPAESSHLYFVSRNDGSHVFADSLAEHNRNVDEWQRRYWRERREADRDDV